MRTARLLPVSPSMHCAGGGLCPGGACTGGCLPMAHWGGGGYVTYPIMHLMLPVQCSSLYSVTQVHAGIHTPLPPMWTEWQTGAKILPCHKLRLRAVISTLKFNSHRSNLISTLHDRRHHLHLVILLVPAEWIQCFPGSCTPLLHSQQTLSLLHKRCLYLRVATCQPTGFAYCVQGSENPSGRNILISDHHRTEVPVPAHHFEPVYTRCLQAMFFVPYLKKSSNWEAWNWMWTSCYCKFIKDSEA